MEVHGDEVHGDDTSCPWWIPAPSLRGAQLS
jgi:hypothetical protein